MAVYTLASQNNRTTAKGTVTSSLPMVKNTYNNSSVGLVAESDGQNNGGLFGGIGYVGEKLGLGLISSIEGLWDFTAGGIAKLFGADDWAEEQFASDWIDYNHADEWFDPSDGWRIAGDVASGIGTSLPSIALSFVPYVGPALSIAYSGLSAAGNATKEAYLKTGELGLKEFGYGTLVGATEAVVEKVTMGIGTGTGRILKAASKSGGKGAKAISDIIAKLGSKTMAKQLTVDFLSEGVEEAISEITSPIYARMTYDEDAEFASGEEILYAALVGGLAGLVMSGGGSAAKSGVYYKSGNKAVQNGKADVIIETAKELSKGEVDAGADEVGYEALKQVKKVYGELSASLESTGGKVETAKQKMLLGELSRANVATQLSPSFEKAAMDILQNPDLVAEAYTALGLKDGNGNPITFTKEELLNGIDVDLLRSENKAERRQGRKQVLNALATNPKLASLAVTQAMGHIMMDAKKFSEAAKSVAARVTDDNIRIFKASESDEVKTAFARDIGYGSLEEFYQASPEDIRSRVEAYLFKNGSKIMEQRKRIKLAETTYGKENALQQNAQSGVDNSSVEAGNGSERLAVSEKNAIVVEADSELMERLKNAKKSKYTVIKEYLVEKFYGEEFTLSDGIEAVMDKSDAQHISDTKPVKVAQLSNLRQIIEKAKFSHSADKVVHDKFDAFRYYSFTIKYGTNTFDMLLNVGHSKYDNKHHIYDITKKGKATNQASPDLARSVDDALKNSSSINSIPQNVENSNTSDKKSSENSADSDGARFSDAAIGVWAKENVDGYNKLLEPSRRAVRDTIRQARAFGFSDAEIRIVASFSAHSGMRVVYDKQLAKGGDGRYNGSNTVYIDPEAPAERRYSRLLLHEGGHALIKQKGFKKLLARATELVSPEKAKEIRDKYTEYYEGERMPKSEYEPIIEEEIAMAAIEDVLGVDGAWDYIFAEEKTFGEKFLDFFRGAARDYSEVSELSKEARKLLNQYKKLFNEFSEKNRGNNAFEDNVIGGGKYALSKNAKRDIKNALNDKNYAGEVKLTDSSPSILLAQKGVRNLPMIMKASHLRENIFTEEEAKNKGLRVNPSINYHGLGEELFLKVIDELDSVTEAYRGTKNAEKSERRENYFLLISQHSDKDGNVINIPIYINEKGVYNRVFIDTNKISTVYGKIELRKYLSEQIRKGNLVKIKARSTQNSESTSPIKADFEMNASANSISQNPEKSTPSTKKDTGERLALPEKSDKVVVSRGELAKMKANFHSDKVFSKKNIVETLGDIEALSKLSSKMRNEIADELWLGYNSRLDAQGFDLFTETMYFKLRAEIEQENGYELSREELATLDKQIYAALSRIVEEGKPSEKASVREKVEKEFNEEKIKAELEIYKRQVNARYKKHWESREATQKRNSIRQQIARLNRRLLKPTKEKNVPHAMQSIIADAMVSVNIDTVGIDKLSELEGKIAQLKRKDVPNEEQIAKLEGQRDKLEARVLKMKGMLAALNEAYKQFEKSDDGLARGAYQAEVAEKMAELREIIGDTPIARMNLDQLGALKDFYDMLMKQIDNSNRLFMDAKKARLSDFARDVMREMVDAKVPSLIAPRTSELAVKANFRKYFWQMLKPSNFFDMLGSDTLGRAFENLRHGEDVWAIDIAEAKSFFNEKAKKYGYFSWDLETRSYEIKCSNGRTVKLTLDQLMSLYAYGKRENAHQHLREGGFTFEPNATYKGKNENAKVFKMKLERLINDSERHTLNYETFSEIASLLTEDQRKFATEMQDYLSTELAKKGNEVSLELYGIKIFGEKFYFPMKCASEWLDSETGKTGDPKTKNKGMTKAVTPDAANPLILSGFMGIWNSHVNDMALYHGLVLPMEDMNKLLNYRNTGGFEEVATSDGRIVAGMSDAERASILEGKKIENIPIVSELSDEVLRAVPEISSWEDINKLFGSQKRTLIQKLASEFGVFDKKKYGNADIDLSFEFSNNNFRESYSKQGKNYVNFAKLFSVFDAVIENAVGIEAHNRNSENYKPDPSLKNVYVLMSAFEDGDTIIPVKLEVKEFEDKQNTLYVAITLEGIKKAEVSKSGSSGDVAQSSRSAIVEVSTEGTSEKEVAHSARSTNISITDLMRKVKPSDTNFTKYFPESLLTSEQRKRINELLARNGLQLSTPLKSTDPVDNISQDREEINSSSQKNSSANIEKYSSMKELIRDKYGDEPIKYLEQLLRDLNGGARSAVPANFLDKGIRNFKLTATAMSLSVTAQQPSSIARAWSIIHPKYFAATPKLDKSGARWAEIKKYAPIAIIKEMGGFDTGTGSSTGSYITEREYKGKEKLAGLVKDKDYRDNAFGFLAAKADEMTWIQIFEACKREQKDLHPELKTDSEELLTLAGQRFTEVIRKTQVYDSTLSRSGMMRSKDTGWKMATAFMAEPTTVINMLASAFVKHSRGEKGLSATIGSIVAATIINSLLASLVYAARDDDEEKTYGEKYVESFVGKTLDGLNPMTMLPFVRDIWSIIQGYEIERSDMSIFSDVYNAVKACWSENKAPFDKAWDLVANLGTLVGIPTRNLMRDARGVYNVLHGAVSGEKGTSTGLGNAAIEGFEGTFLAPFVKKDITNGQQMYDAVMSGDTKHYERVRGRFKDDSTADTALRTALRDNDPRISEAAMAKMQGETATYQEIINKIVAEGHFDRAFVTRAVTSEYLAIKRDIEEMGNAIFIDGVMYSLSEEQKSAIAKEREAFQNEVSAISSVPSFARLTEEQREVALAYAEDLIEDAAESAALGIDNGTNALLAGIIGINNVAILYALTKGLESDKDKNGKTVSGSKRAKVVAAIKSLNISTEEKLLLICAKGYSLKDGDIRGLSAEAAKKRLLRYILSLKGLTKDEMAELAELCGFEVKNGRIVMSSAA